MVTGRWWRFAPGTALALAAQGAHGEWGLNMPRGVTDISREVYDLHMIIFWVCVAIGVVVFGAMFYALFAHRRSRHPEPAHFHENTVLEVVWTAIPFVILIAMAIPATVTLLRMEDTRDAGLTIKVTGYQWRWEYDYIDDGVRYFSNLAPSSRDAIEGDPRQVENYLLEVDNPLVIPIGTKVRFLFTANDVIHAWWVPALGWKQDAIPGFINDAWTQVDEPGIYRGQCAELCGRDHGFMPVVVEAKSRADYDAWLAEQKKAAAAAASGADREWKPEELMARGEQVYNTYCVACHQKDGHGVPGAFPSMVGSPIVTGPLAGHITTVLKGIPGTAMQAFGQQLNDVDIAAVVSYERNSFGNQAGDYAQPRAVAAARQ
jgi:cytochrome c oxidase subunit II